MPLDPKQSIVNTMAIKDNFLYVGMGNYRILVWDMLDYSLIKVIDDGLWEMRSVSVDEKNIYAASLNEKILVFDRMSYQKVNELNHHLGVNTTFCSEKYLYSGSFDTNVNIWNKMTFDLLAQLPNHLVRVTAIHEKDDYIYTGDGFTIPHSKLRIWNLRNFSLHKQIELDCLRTLEIISDEKYIFTAHGGKGSIKIWDGSTFELIDQIDTHRDINSLVLHDDLLIASSRDTLHIYDKHTHELLHMINENEREVNCVETHNEMIVYGSRDQIKFIDLTDFHLVKQININ